MRTLLFFLLCVAGISNACAGRVAIGVLAYDGVQQAIDRWQPTADYLSERIPGNQFEVVPLTHEAFEHSINKRDIDFVLTNPGHYVRLEVAFGVTRIATFRTRFNDQILTRFSSVIFSRKDSEISTLAALEGKKLAAVSEGAFGGFQLAQNVLLDHDINALKEVDMVWLGFPHSDVVRAVLNGEADAGTVRSGVLEKMVISDGLDLSLLTVIGGRKTAGFPFLHSVGLYPEWPFSKLPKTDDTLAKKVAIALFEMPEDGGAAREAGGAGWTIPLDYSSIHQVLRRLKVAPYPQSELSVVEFWRVYQRWIVALGLLFMIAIISMLRLSRSNSALRSAQVSLHGQQVQLEDTVKQRTEELRALNEALQADVALRIESEQALSEGCETLQALYSISNRHDLDREQRLQSIVDLARHFLGAERALLSHYKDQQFKVCTASPGNQNASAPLVLSYAQAVIQESRIQSHDLQPDGGRYIACPVYVEGVPHCLLEFTCTAAYQSEHRQQQLGLSSELRQRILKLISQWLGNEVILAEREHRAQQRNRELRQRFADISPREREVLELLVKGESTKKMAVTLSISPKTIELHRANLLRKTGAKSSIELVKFAVLSIISG